MEPILVTVDASKHRLTIQIVGFVDAAALAAGAKRIIAAAYEARAHAGYFDCLILLSDGWVTPADAAESHRAMLADMAQIGLRRSAQVGFSQLARLQILRLADTGDGYRFFETEKDAVAWLDS